MDFNHLMIEFNNEAHAKQIAQSAQVLLNDTYDVCISRSSKGELLGGSLFTNFTGRSICIHVGSFANHWINKDLLWVTFHYPFIQLGCDKLIGLVPSYNERALEFDRKLGFKEETIIRDVYPEGDMIVLSMYKDDCRWINLTPSSIFQTEYSDGR